MLQKYLISILRISGMVAVYGFALIAVSDTLDLEDERQKLEMMKSHQDRLLMVFVSESNYLDKIKRRQPKTVDILARSWGYHLPGEVDWRLLERFNLHRWNVDDRHRGLE